MSTRPFRLRSDLTRAVIGDFQLPLGVEPGVLPAPTPGYTLTFNQAAEDGPDTYSFDIVVSHEKLAPLLNEAFDVLLPEEVFAIVEIGSRDAYRSTDVYLSGEPLPRNEFLESWKHYESVLLEDSSIGAGANSEEPFVEVFIDHFKGLFIQVPVDMRERVEEILQRAGVREVAETWPKSVMDLPFDMAVIRPVIATMEGEPDLTDELLFELRQMWSLDLNIDIDRNLDEGGKNLGLTLWYAEVMLEHTTDDELMTYATIWATANSLAQLAQLIEQGISRSGPWRFVDFYSVDRIAHDERPEELNDLPPRRERAEIHLLQIDPPTPPDEPEGGAGAAPKMPPSEGEST